MSHLAREPECVQVCDVYAQLVRALDAQAGVAVRRKADVCARMAAIDTALASEYVFHLGIQDHVSKVHGG